MSDYPVISWTEAGETHSARWHSERGVPPPRRVIIANDIMTADAAYRLACEGTAMLWRGDFENARQLLQAMARRVDRKSSKPLPPPPSPAEAFHLWRQARSQRAGTLGDAVATVGGRLYLRERLALQINDGSCIAHCRIQTGVADPLADVIVGIRPYRQCQT